MRKESIINFLRDEEGATAIEYGLVAGLMAVLLAAIFGTGTGTFGAGLTKFFSDLGTYISNQAPKTTTT